MILNEIKLTPLLDTLRLEKISDAIYFSEQYSGYVSNSRLGLLNPRQDGTPEKFFEGFKPVGYAPALEMGSAVHELCLQPDAFELAPDIGKPTAKLGAVADELFKVFLGEAVTKEHLINVSNKVDYYKGKITDERFRDVISKCTPYWQAKQKYEFNLSQDKELIYLDTKSRETVLSCVEAINNNKIAQQLLHPEGLLEDPISENEQAILLDVEAKCPNGKSTIIRLKSKLDNYTIDKETGLITVNDLKTIGKIVSEFPNNVKKFRYSREIAMYLYLLKLCANKFYGIDTPKIKANYLVVSTIPNFYSKVFPVSYNEIKEGFNEFQKLLKYVAYLICYENYSLNERPSKYQL